MIKTPRPQSQFSMAMANFGRNRLSVVCLVIVALMYIAAAFAGFLAPYRHDSENRSHSYAPPSAVHFFDENGLAWPYVHDVKFTFDKYHKRIYFEDTSRKFSLRFFPEGEEYKLLGFIPASRHVFGAEGGARVYLLGADSRGRDLFSRLLYGGQVSLSIGLIGVGISFTLGLLIGGISGYYGGRVDDILMRVCEMFMMVPGFYLILALRSAVPDNFNSLQVYLSIVVILSFIGWAGLARIIRGMAISLREREYVLAARALGLSDLQIITRHILPHTVSYSIVAIMLSIPGYILGEAALSLIGLGIQDPIASWGNMLSEAMAIAHIQMHPWVLVPGAAIFVTVICFNVVGDGLRDSLDPMIKGEARQ